MYNNCSFILRYILIKILLEGSSLHKSQYSNTLAIIIVLELLPFVIFHKSNLTFAIKLQLGAFVTFCNQALVKIDQRS